ncbi:HAMP domain-containing histidine kinase [Sphingobacterium sp. lm-10]|uniref:sensor histidine kinase n=1 Tax=Sphingobacterium sp. lm-10 TaxID=2944904 RepID=UPI00202133C0|nr:HAMP domain-containing sensor histidine kinase [Sphingobacterium sp. lm-10]MCL7986946.1 HAMP domain-containing histidine kinase [Sphingobacterium sp. lm-10]
MNVLDFFARINRKVEEIGIKNEDISQQNIRTRMINTISVWSFIITILFTVLNRSHNPVYMTIADTFYLMTLLIVLYLNSKQFFEAGKILLVSSSIAILVIVNLTYGDAEYHLICVAISSLLILERFSQQLICNIIVAVAILIPKYIGMEFHYDEDVIKTRMATNLMINLFFIILLVKYFISIQQRYQLLILKQKNYLNLQNQKKEQFYAIMAHDMRSPITTSYQCLDMIISGDVDERESKSLLKKISAQLLEINQTAETLTNWINKAEDHYAALSQKIVLKPVLESVIASVALMAAKKEIQISIQVCDSVVVYMDRSHLGTILKNILLNALKFSHRRSEVIISITSMLTQTRISIKDTGAGMSEETKCKLFTEVVGPNTGTEGEIGTGFGLQMSQKLAQANKSFISVESVLYEGSTFHLVIPNSQIQ